MGSLGPGLTLVLIGLLCASEAYAAGLLGACTTDADCEAGLSCNNCPAGGVVSLRCIRSKTTALTNISSLPFNKVAWLTTHNSYSILGFPEETGPRITFYNQENSVTDQLNGGVRGLMLDFYDFLNDIWLCHSIGGECLNLTSFEPAVNTLKEVETFLTANPSEIVTIFIEDYVKTTNGITNVFTAANLTKYWFPLASMPTTGGDWPTIATMIQNNWRLLVFTSQSEKQASEGIPYQWNFVNENQYGDEGMIPGSCPNRAESQFMNTTSRSLILQNFFRTNPLEDESCTDNSQSLYDELDACYTASANRWANFLAVDFYKRSTGGGVFQALDRLNGQMECGCNTPVSCETQTSVNKCPSDPSLTDVSPTSTPSPAPGLVKPSGMHDRSAAAPEPSRVNSASFLLHYKVLTASLGLLLICWSTTDLF